MGQINHAAMRQLRALTPEHPNNAVSQNPLADGHVGVNMLTGKLSRATGPQTGFFNGSSRKIGFGFWATAKNARVNEGVRNLLTEAVGKKSAQAILGNVLGNQDGTSMITDDQMRAICDQAHAVINQRTQALSDQSVTIEGSWTDAEVQQLTDWLDKHKDRPIRAEQDKSGAWKFSLDEVGKGVWRFPTEKTGKDVNEGYLGHRKARLALRSALNSLIFERAAGPVFKPKIEQLQAELHDVRAQIKTGGGSGKALEQLQTREKKLLTALDNLSYHEPDTYGDDVDKAFRDRGFEKGGIKSGDRSERAAYQGLTAGRFKQLLENRLKSADDPQRKAVAVAALQQVEDYLDVAN